MAGCVYVEAPKKSQRRYSKHAVNARPDGKHVSVGLVHLTNEQLKQHHRDIAYEDGYADGREYGKAGFFLPDDWDADSREAYMRGFRNGVRVHNSRNPSRQ